MTWIKWEVTLSPVTDRWTTPYHCSFQERRASTTQVRQSQGGSLISLPAPSFVFLLSSSPPNTESPLLLSLEGTAWIPPHPWRGHACLWECNHVNMGLPPPLSSAQLLRARQSRVLAMKVMQGRKRSLQDGHNPDGHCSAVSPKSVKRF